jgi:hypothetical protein
MESVTGNVQSRGNKLSVDFDKIGNIDKKRTNVYKMQVHEKSTLRFALKGVKASRVELFADPILLSVIVPVYDDTWTEEDVTPINFFGEGKNFHRGLIDTYVEIVVTTDDERLPGIMVGVVSPSKKWEDIDDDIYSEEVVAGSDSGEKNMTLVYHRGGCGFA